MPSQKSLALGQYYGNPQNAFWKVMEQLTSVPFDAPYQERAAAVSALGISIWDTIESCHRPGSMDSDIDPTSVSVNDFDGFIAKHTALALVLFNGQASAKVFVKHTGKNYLADKGVQSQVMPSTSPAYAAMSLDTKKQHWLAALRSNLRA